MCVEFCDCDSSGSGRRVGKKNMISAAKEKNYCGNVNTPEVNTFVLRNAERKSET